MGLAQSYTGIQDYEQAEASYRQLLALDSSNSEGYRELAELYIRLEKLEEAKALLEEAINNTDDEELQEFYEETTPKAPSFTLEEGSYNERQEVGITADKDTHVIHYTIDGTEPTEESPVYHLGAASFDDPKVASGFDKVTYVGAFAEGGSWAVLTFPFSRRRGCNVFSSPCCSGDLGFSYQSPLAGVRHAAEHQQRYRRPQQQQQRIFAVAEQRRDGDAEEDAGGQCIARRNQ